MSLDLELQPARACLRHRDSITIAELPGFVRSRHRSRISGRLTESFVLELGGEALEDEVKAVYAATKRAFSLRRRELVQGLAAGGGNVDGPQFQFSIELGVDPNDQTRALWQRRVTLLVSPQVLPVEFDELFPVPADELVIPFAEHDLEGEPSESFDRLVDLLEDFAELHGGGVEEDESAGRASLATHDGSCVILDLVTRELSLQISGVDGARALLLEAQRRFASLVDPIIDGFPET